MKTVYLVTSGEYSDYSVDAVFSTKEKAQKYIDCFEKNNGYRGIEEFDIDPYEEQINKGYSPYFVRMNKKGTVLDIKRYSHICNYDSFDVDLNLITHVLAKDEKHAIKITNEKRTKLIALNQWKE